jgi:hypothetical protein
LTKEAFDYIDKYTKQREFYKKAVIDPKSGETWPYIPHTDENKYYKWKEEVIDPSTNEYYLGKVKKYEVAEDGKETEKIVDVSPYETIRQITRIRTDEGKEFLLTKGSIMGFNEFGRERRLDYTNKEMYRETLFRFETDKDPSVNRLRQFCKGPEGFLDHYLMPFTPANVDKLWSKRDKKRCLLAVLDKITMQAKECPTLDMFKNKDFDYIMDMGYLSEKEKEEKLKEFEAMQNIQSPQKPSGGKKT